MKTVCPHCQQKYDVTTEHLNGETQCEKCNKSFVIEPAIFCTECGVANSEKNKNCFRCDKSLKFASETEKPLKEPPRSIPVEEEITESTSQTQFELIRICTECGTRNPSRNTNCFQCKRELESPFMVTGPQSSVIKTNAQQIGLAACPACRAKISTRAVSCPHCGQPMSHEQQYRLESGTKGTSTPSLVCGIIGMIAWLFPLLGFPVTIVGLILGIRTKYTTGIILNIVGLSITLINSAIGATLGAQGRLF